MPDASTETRRSDPKINLANFKGAEYERTVWIANIAHGLTLEDVLSRAYWSHVCAQMKPWDKVELRADDGTWYAEAIVLDCSRTWAQLHVICHENLTSADVAQSQAEIETKMSDYLVKWAGAAKWRVIRKSDGAVLQDQIQQKPDAVAWLANYVSTEAARSTVT